MRYPVARIRGLGFILWQSRHTGYHLLLGAVWAWILRERWNEFNPRWIWLSLFGSVVPDIDHFVYFLTYGRHDSYTIQVKKFLRQHQWRTLIVYMAHGHKENTNLASHNYYVMVLLLTLSLASSFFEWQVGVILFGAMVIHYVFDIGDDLVMLGRINPNWKRWGRERVAGRSMHTPDASR